MSTNQKAQVCVHVCVWMWVWTWTCLRVCVCSRPVWPWCWLFNPVHFRHFLLHLLFLWFSFFLLIFCKGFCFFTNILPLFMLDALYSDYYCCFFSTYSKYLKLLLHFFKTDRSRASANHTLCYSIEKMSYCTLLTTNVVSSENIPGCSININSFDFISVKVNVRPFSEHFLFIMLCGL